MSWLCTNGAWALGLLCVLATPGCSLIFDADTFSEVADASPPPDAEEPPPDVDIGALALTDTVPSFVYEGTGCIPEGAGCSTASRAVPIVIRGSSMALDATVTIDGAGFDSLEVDATVSSDGMLAAFPLIVPVMPALAEGATEKITITVSQGMVNDSVMLDVRGLDEFVASVDASTGTLGVSMLDPMYSTIDIDATIAFTGTAPARLIATASLIVDAALDADGSSASGTTGGDGGAGGCKGGDNETPGDCLLGGGRDGAAHAGGGGGGHASVGVQGASGGGAGGIETGSDEMVPLSAEAGNGGGGGGDGTLGSGGGGGGGGGVIELTSFGALEIGTSALMSAAGGAGSGGTGGTGCILTEHGGGGGGGAGGGVFVRALQQLVEGDTTTRVAVDPGSKGNAGCNAGGDGAVGRVRVDVPSADPTPSFAGTTLYRGPVLSPATDAIVTSSTAMVELFGDAGTKYYVQREGGTLEEATTSSERRVTHPVSLEAGLNRVCAVVRDDVSISSAEGTNCVTIAYIP